MPTEEELEQLVTDHIDREKAVDEIENVSGLRKSDSREQKD